MSDRKAEPEWEPSTWDELFPGKFLKHSHLRGETELHIVRVYNTTIDGELAQVAQFQPVRGIAQVDWGLNKTNGICLRAMFGDAIKKDWTGKRVTVKPSVVEHGREKGKPCIRVCASSDIPADLKVVVDFKTKRIKPFIIVVRSGMHTPEAMAGGKRRPDASPAAKAMAAQLRASVSIAELTQLSQSVESAMDNQTITPEEGDALLTGITKRAEELAAKAASEDVIT